MTDRATQVAQALAGVRARIEAACRAAGRANDVGLVVVTKFHPASDVAILAGLGVTDVGENRDQEARRKREELEQLPGIDAAAVSGLRWHMLGQVQRNKAASVVRWADLVESVDRPELAAALGRAAQAAGRTLDVLVQVSLDPLDRPERGGVPVPGVQELADTVAGTAGLRLAGVMAVAPHPDEGVPAGAAFARLDRVHADVIARHPQARILSAGMSDDLQEAIAHGATQVRIGAAVLGPRPLVQ